MAGNLCYSDKPGEPAVGVKVTLSCCCCKKVYESVTDFFGDFEFKGLENNKEYVLSAQADGYARVELKARANASKNFGAIELEKK